MISNKFSLDAAKVQIKFENKSNIMVKFFFIGQFDALLNIIDLTLCLITCV